MIECNITRSYDIDEYHKPVAENRSQHDRHVAGFLVRDVLLALLHDNSRNDAVLSILVRLRASRLQQSDQTDERSGPHSGLHLDDPEADRSLV